MKNLVGQRFSHLLVTEMLESRSGGQVVYRCHCDCGKEKVIRSNNLRSGNTKSCGCLNATSALKHGSTASHKVTREYKTWCGMKERCMNQKKECYKNYGGRGIKVCDEWLHSFENFLAYLKANKMYPKPVGMSLDRYPNNDGNYEPGNIRWATSSQQRQNQRNRRS